jgi:hypothetical protein
LAALGAQASGTTVAPLSGTLGLPEPLELAAAGRPFPHGAHFAPNRPHPAVARIVVPEGNTAVSYGSGTLVDVRDQFGLVVTNWHVVRDGTGEVEVIFPDGFRSKARPLKVDSDWDLAALVIWRPPVEPVSLASVAPQPGDQLTICGYGSGQYRAATGHCTQYYAPALNLPQHMVELDVEARQGDSGGPIFNERGELAGVLFGAGRGTTLGSFGGRVESFLGTLAPDIGRTRDAALVHHDAAPSTNAIAAADALAPSKNKTAPPIQTASVSAVVDDHRPVALDNGWHSVTAKAEFQPVAAPAASGGIFAHSKNVLAVVGVLALMLQVLRAVR